MSKETGGPAQVTPEQLDELERFDAAKATVLPNTDTRR